MRDIIILKRERTHFVQSDFVFPFWLRRVFFLLFVPLNGLKVLYEYVFDVVGHAAMFPCGPFSNLVEHLVRKPQGQNTLAGSIGHASCRERV